MSAGARRRGRPQRIQPLDVVAPAGWRACPTCPPEENVWPESAFRQWEQAGAGARPLTPICGACLFERYPKVHRACATCGGRIAYHPARAHVQFPQCRGCAGIPVCTRCKRPRGELDMVGDVCLPCYRWLHPTQAIEVAA